MPFLTSLHFLLPFSLLNFTLSHPYFLHFLLFLSPLLSLLFLHLLTPYILYVCPPSTLSCSLFPSPLFPPPHSLSSFTIYLLLIPCLPSPLTSTLALPPYRRRRPRKSSHGSRRRTAPRTRRTRMTMDLLSFWNDLRITLSSSPSLSHRHYSLPSSACTPSPSIILGTNRSSRMWISA